TRPSRRPDPGRGASTASRTAAEILRSRSAAAEPELVLKVVAHRTDGFPDGPDVTTASPTALVPGSTPSTTRSPRSNIRSGDYVGAPTGSITARGLLAPAEAFWHRPRLPGRSAHLGEDLVGDIEVRVHRLDVVQVLELLDQPEHRAGLVGADGHVVLRQHREVRRGHLDPGFLQGRPHIPQGLGLGHD